MKINLWYCNVLNLWRWSITDNHRPICKQETGQNSDLQDAMSDIEKTVKCMKSKF